MFYRNFFEEQTFLNKIKHSNKNYLNLKMNFGNLKLVEIEIFNYCNRTCEFCPNETIDRKSLFVIELPEPCFLQTLQELKNQNFNGYVTFSRYNEPLSQDKLLKKSKTSTRISTECDSYI